MRPHIFMFSSASHRRVHGSDPRLSDRWDADLHVRALVGGPGWTTIGALAGRVVEGVRETDGPLFRPTDLVELALVPGPAHFTAPKANVGEAVGLGDVVLSKLFPVRAAVVTAATPRIAVDANCIRLIGLTAGSALWIAAIMVHESFGPSLLHLSAGRMLPRIGVRDLIALELPAPPIELEGLAVEWGQAVDEQINAVREIGDLRIEVQQIADESAGIPPDAQVPSFVPAAQLPNAWLPDHVARARYAAELSERGWPALATLLVPEPERLRQRVPPIRVLRLFHADDALGFAMPAPEPAPEPLFRIFAQPLRDDEVLLSTLGSAPKVLFHHPRADSAVWVTDAWARLAPHPTAGALALALTTRQVAWQLERAATGVVRQYVGRDELAEIRIPALPNEAAARIHRRLCHALERRTVAATRIALLRRRVDASIAHRLSAQEIT